MRTDLTPLENQLIKHEALRLKPYRCSAGKLTIGIGRNLDDNGITESEALVLLRNDIDNSTADLTREFSFFPTLDEVRREVLLNMCFNMGITTLRKFTRLFTLVEAGDFEGAAKSMLASKWANQVGPRAKELAEQMRSGQRRID